MKYILTIIFISLVSIGKGQVPPHGGMPYPDPMQPIPRDKGKPCTRCWPKIKDTTPPSFHDMVFLMQQNMELLQRLDRLENREDSLEHELGLKDSLYKFNISMDNYLHRKFDNKIDSLERRPLIYIDNLQKELWVKCPDGSCDIFIRKL